MAYARSGIYLKQTKYETFVSESPEPHLSSFDTLHEATRLLNCCGFPHDQINIHTAESASLSLAEYCKQIDTPVPCESGRLCYSLIDLGKKFHAELCFVLGELCCYEYVIDSHTKTIMKRDATFGVELLNMWVGLMDKLKGDTIVVQSPSNPLLFTMKDMRMPGEDICEVLREANMLYT